MGARDDLTATQATLTTPQAREMVPLKDVLQLKSKIEFRLGQHEAALRDLDAAIRENYDDAMSVFNDGEVDPSAEAKPCAWTMPDLKLLATQFPDDYRPALYQGLCTAFFLRLKPGADHTFVIEAYERAAKLNPQSPLPTYFLGVLHAFGSIGGLFSSTSASCIEDIAPESEACEQFAGIRRRALRHFTSAIAVSPDFRPAYSSRAALLLRLKEYRQAIRDYDRALLLKPTKNEARIIYNDRALAKMQLGDNAGATVDLDKSIAIGCESGCNSYENRAEAHLKVGNYTAALADLAASIRFTMSNAIYRMNIDTFRKLYPEYDDVADDVVCEKLRALFYPQESYEQFAHHFLIGEAKLEPTFILSDFYLKRGDLYARKRVRVKTN